MRVNRRIRFEYPMCESVPGSVTGAVAKLIQKHWKNVDFKRSIDRGFINCYIDWL